MPIDGIEPPTFALQERRSTTKPNRHFDGKNFCLLQKNKILRSNQLNKIELSIYQNVKGIYFARHEKKKGKVYIRVQANIWEN